MITFTIEWLLSSEGQTQRRVEGEVRIPKVEVADSNMDMEKHYINMVEENLPPSTRYKRTKQSYTFFPFSSLLLFTIVDTQV